MTSKTFKSTVAALALASLSSATLCAGITLNKRSTYTGSAAFAESAAEIVAFDARTDRLFVVNANLDAIDVLDISDVDSPQLVKSIDLSALGSPNSVAVNPSWFRDEIAIAVANPTKTENGWVVFCDTDGNFLNQIEVGALPDMLTYDDFGFRVLVANEGEPNDDYTIDPEGSVSVIYNFWGAKRIKWWHVKTIGFGGLTSADLPESVRVFGPGASIAQDFEPEYIALNSNGTKAWVVLQENNAIAVINLWSCRIEKILSLGTIDHSATGFGIDASNDDDAINIANWPVCGFPLPDAIASYKARGKTYYITANEGDSRDYDGYSEEERVKDLDLDPIAFPDAATLQEDQNLGRLKITSANGNTDADAEFEKLYSYGTRSFSIWDSAGNLVFDSGDEFEQITASLTPDGFNSTNDENDSFDNRSDDKGPEPEGVTTGKIRGRTYAFIGLERVGGIMVYDVTNPRNPEFIEYTNNRNFDVEFNTNEDGDPDPTSEQLLAAGDLGPEGILFIPAYQSPTKSPLLVVGNEVSGTTTIFEIMPTK